jgi:hypothetical protein
MTDAPLPFGDLAIASAFGHFMLRRTPGADDE